MPRWLEALAALRSTVLKHQQNHQQGSSTASSSSSPSLVIGLTQEHITSVMNLCALSGSLVGVSATAASVPASMRTNALRVNLLQAFGACGAWREALAVSYSKQEEQFRDSRALLRVLSECGAWYSAVALVTHPELCKDEDVSVLELLQLTVNILPATMLRRAADKVATMATTLSRSKHTNLSTQTQNAWAAVILNVLSVLSRNSEGSSSATSWQDALVFYSRCHEPFLSSGNNDKEDAASLAVLSCLLKGKQCWQSTIDAYLWMRQTGAPHIAYSVPVTRLVMANTPLPVAEAVLDSTHHVHDDSILRAYISSCRRQSSAVVGGDGSGGSTSLSWESALTFVRHAEKEWRIMPSRETAGALMDLLQLSVKGQPQEHRARAYFRRQHHMMDL